MIDLLKKISDSNIYLDVIDGELKLFSESGHIDRDLLLEIKRCKAELTAYLIAQGASRSGQAVTGIPVLPVAESYPVSHAQKRLWILCRDEAHAAAYNMPNTVTLPGSYDPVVFREAVLAVVARHEMLRTVFEETASGEIRQRVLPVATSGFNIDYRDYSAEADGADAAQQYISTDSVKVFDLAQGPLIRACLIRIAADSYLFYYNMHHIISDGWSLDVLGRDVLVCYNALLEGVAPSLPVLEIQYKDYASWQLAQLDTEAIAGKMYWQQQLSGDMPTLDYPAASTRPATKSFAGHNLLVAFPADLASGIGALCQQEGGSLFMGLLTMWNILTYRYTGVTDIVIGSPVSGRDHFDLKDQIGFYVNTLALRNQVDPGESFRSLFRRVREHTLAAFAHQAYPFDLVVESLGRGHAGNRNVLFDVALVLQQENGMQSDLADDAVLDCGSAPAMFDITVSFRETATQLLCQLNFNTAIYEYETMERLVRHFRQLAAAVVAAPDKPLCRLDMLLPAEEEQQLVAFNNTATDYPAGQSVPALFREQALLYPERTALVCGAVSWTYTTLDQQSRSLAAFLQTRYELVPGDRVGISLERSHWIVVAGLAVLNTGCAYVPLDPAYPAERIAYMETDSACRCIIDQAVLDAFLATDIEALDFTAPAYSPDQLAYIMYTSGSTGLPKGVMVGHEGIVRLVKHTNYYSFKPEDVLLATGSFSFDATTFEFWGPLLNGGCLVISSQEVLLDSRLLAAEIRDKAVNIMWFTAGWLNQLVDTQPDLFAPLRTVIAGGDRLSPVHISRLQNRYPALELINGYGPTENTTFSLTYKITASVEGDIPLGYPISNSTAYILDAHARLLPLGAVGEICVGGAGLAQGYCNLPELTQDRFIEHPYQPGLRLYRTGDRGRWLPDGRLVFLGRADNQVKIRGHRIEPGEIEAKLLAVPGVRNGVVTIGSWQDEKVIVAYFEATGTLDAKTLRKALAAVLPAYLLPGYYVQLDTVPLNANGKVDRNALPEIMEHHAITEEFVAAGTVQEKALLAVWETVLGRAKISIKDNFYNLGGDSIKAIQVVARLRESGYRVKIEQILRSPVLEELAALLESDTLVIDQGTVTGPVLLTPIQHSFFLDPAIINKHHFNQSVLLKSSQPLDPERITLCLRQLVLHHDALRMQYHASATGWEQEVRGEDAECFTLNSFDLTGVADPEAAMKEIAAGLQAGMDITAGILVKAGHFRLDDSDRLLLVIHHLVVDGISWRILLEDLSTGYRQLQNEEMVSLPLKTHAFQSWASALEAYAATGKMKAERVYWEGLDITSVPPIPCEETSAATPIFIDQHVSFVLDADSTASLQTQVHRVYNTEMNDVLLTALGLALRDVFAQCNTLIKLEGHGREPIAEDIDISRTVGWFTSVYPFVLKHPANADYREVLVQTKEDLRRIPGKGIGYGILSQYGDNFEQGFYPGLVFNYLGDFGEGISGQGDAVFEYAPEVLGFDSDTRNGADCALLVSGMISHGSLKMTLHYSGVHYPSDRMAALAQAYRQQLTQVIASLAQETTSYRTPADMTYKGLDSATFAKLNAANDIEDLYPLAPLQKSIYFHWLSERESEAYFEQLSYRVTFENITLEAVEQAYQQLVQRYAILRTRFTSDYGDQPLQLVYKSVPADFRLQTLPAAISEEQLPAYIESVKAQDRVAGFDLEQSPSQMRLTVIVLHNGRYEFIWSFHHILMDGWCMSILVNDFYSLLTSGAHLPAPKPYAAYIAWLEEIEQQASLAYWKNYLGDYHSRAEVPFKNAVAPVAYEAGREHVLVGGDLFAAMDELCRRMQVTHSTFIQAAWAYLLSCYNNTDDVVFGTVVSGRPGVLPGIENMVGLFINTIPVRLTFEATDTPETLLAKLHKATIESQQHHYLNLSEVQALSELGSALIDHVIVFENYPVQDLIGGGDGGQHARQGIIIEDVAVVERTNYDFDITASVSGANLEVKFDFNKNAYDAPAINRLAGHLYNIITQFCNQPAARVRSFDYLDKTERDELVFGFNNTVKHLSVSETFLDVFARQVQTLPNKTAVICGDRSCTYAELDRLSDELAGFLQQTWPLERGSIVALVLERSEWLLISILAVFKAGAAYLPVDPSYPQDRIDYLLNNSRCGYHIDADLLSVFRAQQDKTHKRIPVAVAGGDLAYVIYTSGSTGNPKGVMIEHSGMLNHLYAMAEEMLLDEHSIIVQNAPSTFDISVWQLLNALLVGGITSIYSQPVILDPDLFLERVSREGVTVLQVVPSYIKSLLEVEAAGNKRHLDKLSYLLVTGEAVSKALLDLWFVAYPGVKVINAYGPAEASDDVTLHIMDSAPADVAVPIGKPIRNMSVYVLDRNLRLCGKGVEGEICVAGIGIARGYLHMPELTAEKFKPNPFNETQTLYTTGDIGKWLEDGSLTFTGRRDDQVKIRGHRIELGEIEHQLQQKEDIEQVVVVARTTASGKELVAYFVAGSPQQAPQLNSFLAALLPAYMLPAYYVQLEAIPLTANGKIDKRALPDVSDSDLVREDYIAPRNPEEAVLAGVWRNVLKRDQISIKDNFYNLGGDSIKSIQVVARLKQEGYVLRIDQIMRTPVIAELARLMKTVTVQTDQAEITGDTPLTPVQQAFFESPGMINRNYYNQSVLLHCTERVDLDILDRCWAALTEHHDVLRMRYTAEGASWKQYNHGVSDKNYTIVSHDLRTAPEEQKALLQYCTSMQSSLDISEGPLCRIGHFTLEGADRLLLVIHHLVVDGVSWRILLEDLAALYEGYSKTAAVSLPLKTESFRAWSLALNRFVAEGGLDQERPYWEQMLARQVPAYPFTAVAANQFRYNQVVNFSLDAGLTELLQTRVHQVFNTDVNDVLLTALALAIQELFGIDRFFIELEGHGREAILDGIDISRTVGWFTSFYPLLLDVSATDGLLSAVVKIKETLRKVPAKGIGYSLLRYLGGILSHQVKPGIAFNYLGEFGNGGNKESELLFSFAAESAGPESATENTQTIALDISGVLFSGTLNMSLKYDNAYFPETVIRELTAGYKANLEALVTALGAETGTYLTPADLTFNKLSIAELATLNTGYTVEDVYELSPLQQGMYYFWLLNQDKSLYFEQTSYTLHATGLDREVIGQAYELLIARYPVLRTRFVNHYGGVPLQVVCTTGQVHYQYLRLPQGMDAATFTMQRREEDKALGFDLEMPSQMRLTVLDLAPGHYEFIWSHHHILMDGWCMSIIINDFYRLLNGLVQGIPARLPEPESYARYIQWLTGRDKLRSLAYWEAYLGGYGQTAAIPFRRPVDTDAYLHEKSVLVIDGQLFDRIRTLCADCGVTPSTFVQAVWGRLLAAYNNTTDVVFGAVVSGRPGELEGVEEMIGLFINTVPVRVSYGAEDTPRCLLQKVHNETIDSSAHHYVNLSEIQSRSECGNDLIDHILVFENYPVQDAIRTEVNNSNDLDMRIEAITGFDQTNYDFNLTCESTTQALVLKFEYNKAAYDSGSMEAMTGHFQRMAEQFCSRADAPLAALDYLSTEEKEILLALNPAPVAYDNTQTIIGLFREQVARYPAKTAVIFEDRHITYAELDTLSAQFAVYLTTELGVQPQDKVLVGLDKSEWMIVSILAVLRCGAAYIPVDPAHPAEVKQFMQEDSKASLCIGTEHLHQFTTNRTTYTSAWQDIAVAAADVAYIIYTSGSTGNPKGVLVAHQSVVNICSGWRTAYRLGDFDVSLLQLASFSFDVSVADICRSLLVGGTMVLCPNDQKLDMEAVAGLLADYRISLFEGTPSLVLPIMHYAADHNLSLDALQLVILGGEALSLKDYTFLRDRFPGQRVINSYGVTEATIDSTYFEAAFGMGNYALSGTPIGRPFPNVRMYVLDERQALVPAGVPGELCIGGDSVAIGYLNREALSAAKFVEDPFYPGQQLYKTGDLGRWLTNGMLEFIGRKDSQVKVNGYRIEPGEIEFQLLAIPGVREAVVLAREQGNSRELVAYYTANQDLDIAGTRTYLLDRMPAYMCPAWFVRIPSIPLTVNGKINKRALPDHRQAGLSVARTYTAPHNDTEAAIVRVIAAELGFEPEDIGVHDNFFDLGMNSIKLLRVLSGINSKLGVQVKPALLFEYPNVHDLVRNVFMVTETVTEEGEINMSDAIDDFLSLIED